jgi:hypothetical protein
MTRASPFSFPFSPHPQNELIFFTTLSNKGKKKKTTPQHFYGKREMTDDIDGLQKVGRRWGKIVKARRKDGPPRPIWRMGY